MSGSPANNSQAFSLSEALKRLGRPVVFIPALARIIGIKEAIVLAQLVYWTPRSRNEQGWIYKSAEDMEEETSLTYREQCRVRKSLRSRGLIEERFKREEHRLYFRVIPDGIDRLTTDGGAPDKTSDAHLTKGQTALHQTSSGSLPFVSSYKEAESTSEITAERAAPVRGSQDTRSAPVPSVENAARQFSDQFKKLTREKSLPATGRPTEPLRGELYGGIFRKKIENVFLDLHQASFTEQLHGCVREATTSLMLNRTGKTIGLREEDIQKLAIAKLEATPRGLEAIHAVQDGSHRALLISRLIAHLVADAAAEPLGSAYRRGISAKIVTGAGAASRCVRAVGWAIFSAARNNCFLEERCNSDADTAGNW